MDTAESTIKTLSAGRILDVATGSGNFVKFLVENVKDYKEIVGIDTSEKASTTFGEAFKDDPKVRFKMMDAQHMDFPDGTFDTVCISNSMHHMAEIKPVMEEMKRVIRAGGHFIVAEMYQDNQIETQMTHVLLHHWWAAVDTAMGITHRETYSRQQIFDIVTGLGLQNIIFDDVNDLNDDPKNLETVKYLSEVIDQYLKRIERLPGESHLRKRGLELRQRVTEIGFHSAPWLLIIGEKS
jgi:ubiquinone/menaquinone biosynthesis C-methylase UbiE